MIHNALVVGLGRIGMGYDLTLDPATYVLSHARAFQRHEAFRLAGGVDPDPEKRRQFTLQYGVPAWQSVEAVEAQPGPMVVAISTPTEFHGATVRAVLNRLGPRAILCEKPISYDLAEATGVVQMATEHSCGLYVNYMRRSEPGVAEIKRRLWSGEMMKPVRGIVWYSKGLLHNGSHFLNLLEYWLGKVTGFTLIQPGRLWADKDPEPDVQVCFERGTATFLAAREEDYSHYTVELVTASGRLRYDAGGQSVKWQPAVADPVVAGYRTLSEHAEIIATDLDRSQWHVADQLACCLRGIGTDRICTGIQGLETLQALAKIEAAL